MSDEQNGQENIVEETPQVEVTTTDKPDELPEEASDRTREQFEKLKTHNKELAERLKSLESQSVPNVMMPLGNNQPPQVPPTLAPQQVQAIKDELTYTGEDGYKYIDPVLLQKKLEEANERARRAEEAALSVTESYRRSEETKQFQDTVKEFPEFNPYDKERFDEDFYELVRAEMMKGFADTGKKDLMTAARKVKARIEKYSKSGSDRQRAEQVQTQKEQINSTGRGASRGPISADADQLRKDVMMNRPGALAERLKRSGY